MTYWTAPEDITERWARIRPTLEKAAVNGGLVSITVLVSGKDAINLSCRNDAIEGKIPTIKGKGWWMVIRRIISANSRLNGRRGLISIIVWCNPSGHPIGWTEPIVQRLEPVRR